MNPVRNGLLSRLLDLPALLRHLGTRRAGRSVHDPAQNLELALYGAIFGNDFLHYGYFPQPPANAESISFADLQRAMDDYATLLVQRVRPSERVLDVGCGTGGLLARLDAAGAQPVGVTPNTAHAAHIRGRWPQVPLIEAPFEEIDPKRVAFKFDAVVNAESFQYIDLDAGISNVVALLAPRGRWIVIDHRLLSPARRREKQVRPPARRFRGRAHAPRTDGRRAHRRDRKRAAHPRVSQAARDQVRAAAGALRVREVLPAPAARRLPVPADGARQARRGQARYARPRRIPARQALSAVHARTA